MPVYEYECGSCGGRFEAVRKFSDPELAECALCRSSDIRKILSPPAFVLKGSGWYVTDYPSSDRQKASALEQPKTEAKKEQPKEGTKSAAGCASGCCTAGCASKGQT
jgi:putative FmdB family regulatory protein